MIQRVDSPAGEALAPLCGHTALGTRILGTLAAYGTHTSGVEFWAAPGLAFGLTDDVLTLAGVPGAEETEEIRLFVQSLAPRAVVCGAAAAEALGLTAEACGPVLVRPGQGECRPCGGFARAEALQLRRLCGFLQTCETRSFRAPEPEGFYMDFSHRVRHGAAEGELLLQDGQPAACALAVAVTGTDALLSAVAVRPDLRRRGLGRAAVEGLCARLGGRRCHLLRAEDENEAFYRALGFKENGRWAQCSGR